MIFTQHSTEQNSERDNMKGKGKKEMNQSSFEKDFHCKPPFSPQYKIRSPRHINAMWEIHIGNSVLCGVPFFSLLKIKNINI